MKHASPSALEKLAGLLLELRLLPGLKERKTGVFYRRSQAFLHFHEDSSGLFADIKLNLCSFERWPVNTQQEQAALLKAIQAAIDHAS